MSSIEIITLLCSLPAALFALSFHEFSHGLAAHWLGDDTAKNAGRLSLNPLRHLDPFGVICMLLFHFGWAKPVPVSAYKFKRPKRDMALTALAGPVSNLLLALVGVFVFAVVTPHLEVEAVGGMFYYYEGKEWQLAIYLVLQMFYTLNLTLAIFNFLPIPPLDGSRIFLSFLPDRLYFKVMRYERKILLGVFIYFIVCRAADSFLHIDIDFVSRFISFLIFYVEKGLFFLVKLLPFV